MKKKSLSLLLAVMLFAVNLCTCAAAEAGSVTVSKSVVTVAGSVPEPMKVSIMVYPKEAQWSPETCLFADSAASGEDGSYRFTFTLPAEVPSGDYAAYVGDASGGVAVYEFTYSGLLDEILKQVANTGKLELGALEKVIRENAKAIGVDIAAYDNLTDAKKTAVMEAMAGKNYEDIAAFAAAFDELVSRQGAAVPDDEKPGREPSRQGGSGGKNPKTTVVPITNPAAQEQNAQAAFSDLESVPWAKPYIEELTRRGIVSGDGDGTFAPNRAVTRAEFLKMLVLALDLYDPSSACAFSDVGKGDWFDSYVASGVSYGLVSGYPDGRFGVNEPIRREDMAVMAHRALKAVRIALEDASLDAFADADAVSGYAGEAVGTLAVAGVLTGADGLFRPGTTATRAETAKLVGSLLQLKNGGNAA